uniref:Transcriptional regulator n=1 Tax=Meloidogyne hapla TaxID=6305 RepID=A0A1I8BFR6_MELHA
VVRHSAEPKVSKKSDKDHHHRAEPKESGKGQNRPSSAAKVWQTAKA